MDRSFDVARHPIVFQSPRRLTPDSAWVEHIPFAMLVVELTEPRLFVELGTHGGDSYCAFCQAVDTFNLPTRCFAVDTWKGDEHAGFFTDEVRRRSDAIISELTRGSTLYRNDGDGRFTDVSDAAGVRDVQWGWASEFLDYDDDGRLDLYAVNGFISGPLLDDV